MIVDKIIKRQTLSLMVIVITLIIFICTIMYVLFFEIDNYSKSKSDFEISFCTDKSCNKTYYNYNNLIGVKNINNKTVLREIKYHSNSLYAVLDTPYVFNITNNTYDSKIGIRLSMKNDYLENNSYKKYINNINIAISNEDNFKIIKYNDINEYILSDISIKNSETKKFYIWLWSDININENIYFPLGVEVIQIN